MRTKRYSHLTDLRWWLRLATAMALVLGPMAAFAAFFRVGINVSDCVPHRVFVMTRQAPAALERGEFYAFDSRGAGPHFADGTRMMKLLAGLPGDRLRVAEGRVSINGEPWGELPLADQAPAPIERDEVIPAGHYVFLGTSPTSYDSRYWGYVQADQIRAKAWPLM